MKYEKYKVLFVTGLHEVVYALDYNRAKIIAQAEQIEKGNDYSIKEVYIWDEGRKEYFKADPNY